MPRRSGPARRAALAAGLGATVLSALPGVAAAPAATAGVAATSRWASRQL
ncbi:hypothetical protein [Streptomyces sp. NPDC048643]